MNTELIDTLASSVKRDSRLRLRKGKVVSVQAGTLTATIGGSTVQIPNIPYGAHMSPVANQNIWLLRTDGMYLAIMIEA